MKKRKRTEKSRYKHESTGDHCTCAAYVAEIMCKRKAEIENKGSLSYKFWNKAPWNWTFKRQMFVANTLLKDFSEQALVKAVLSNECKRIFSLNHPNMKGIIRKYELVIQQQKDSHQQIDIAQSDIRRKGGYKKKKSTINQLRAIENGKEEEKG